jgi:ketosteroid isomerase-like protein
MRARSSVFLSICFLVFFFNTSIAAGKRPMTPTDAVRAADEEWMKVSSAKDIDKSVAFCDEKGAVLSPNAPIAEGRQAIAKSFSGFFSLPALKITWHADKADAARSGELGYTSGTYQMSFSDSAGKTISDRGKYVTVWKEQSDGSWEVLLDIFNSDMPAGS